MKKKKELKLVIPCSNSPISPYPDIHWIECVIAHSSGPKIKKYTDKYNYIVNVLETKDYIYTRDYVWTFHYNFNYSDQWNTKRFICRWNGQPWCQKGKSNYFCLIECPTYFFIICQVSMSMVFYVLVHAQGKWPPKLRQFNIKRKVEILSINPYRCFVKCAETYTNSKYRKALPEECHNL